MTRIKDVVAKFIAPVVCATVATAAHAQGIPTANPLTYSGVAYLNNQPAAPGQRVDITVVRSNGAVACMGTATTVAGGRFSAPLPNSCVAVVETDNGIEVEVRLNNVSIGQAAVTAAPYAVEAKNARFAAQASAATGALQTTISDIASDIGMLQTSVSSLQSLLTRVAGLEAAGSFCGQTAPTTGNINGYPGAAVRCRALAGCSSTTAHMCSSHEVAVEAANGQTFGYPNGTFDGGWVAALITTYDPNARETKDCDGWTSAANNINGAELQVTPTTIRASGCGSSRPIICCN